MSISLVDAETITAISATFHTSKDYEKFYENYGPQLDGFPGIWNFCAKMGMAFAEAERTIKPEWDGQWIDAIDSFITTIYAKITEKDEVSFTEDELLQIAKDIINTINETHPERGGAYEVQK